MRLGEQLGRGPRTSSCGKVLLAQLLIGPDPHCRRRRCRQPRSAVLPDVPDPCRCLPMTPTAQASGCSSTDDSCRRCSGERRTRAGGSGSAGSLPLPLPQRRSESLQREVQEGTSLILWLMAASLTGRRRRRWSRWTLEEPSGRRQAAARAPGESETGCWSGRRRWRRRSRPSGGPRRRRPEVCRRRRALGPGAGPTAGSPSGPGWSPRRRRRSQSVRERVRERLWWRRWPARLPTLSPRGWLVPRRSRPVGPGSADGRPATKCRAATTARIRQAPPPPPGRPARSSGVRRRCRVGGRRREHVSDRRCLAT
jgi:hypothetical protein